MPSHAHPAVRVGHVHLRVADLDRAIAFYRDALGFRLVVDGRTAGVDVAFLAAGDYHHHRGCRVNRRNRLRLQRWDGSDEMRVC